MPLGLGEGSRYVIGEGRRKLPELEETGLDSMPGRARTWWERRLSSVRSILSALRSSRAVRA